MQSRTCVQKKEEEYERIRHRAACQLCLQGRNQGGSIQKIFNAIDLNDTYWEENLVAEMSEEEFDEVYGED